MTHLAIKGHKTRGKEVIQLLEMLGGKSNGNVKGYNDDLYYFIAKDGLIYGSGIEYVELACNYSLFTLEEFLEKFPYKVGDIVEVRETDKVFSITNMIWGDELSVVHYGDMEDIVYYTADELKPLQENKCLQELKGCLQEFKEYLDNATPEQLEEEWKELEKFSEVGPVADEYVEQCKENVNTNNSCTRCVYAVDNHCGLRGFTNDFNRLYCSAQNADKLPNGFELQPDGYFSWVDSKPKYPTTYEECCKILNIPFNGNIVYAGHWAYGGEYLEKHLDILRNFQKLYICLNAYWKLAGEEMGLGKPWKPDWSNDSETKFCIYTTQNMISLDIFGVDNRILAFPTEEMRNDFYENFKDLINDCKELL